MTDMFGQAAAADDRVKPGMLPQNSILPRQSSNRFIAFFLNPYLLIFVGALLDSTAEVLLKRGAIDVPATHGVTQLFGVTALASGWTWLGIISYVSSFVSWLYVLRLVPLSIAFPLINVVHIIVPFGAKLFLHEKVPPLRWIGIAAIVSGAFLIIRPLTRAEEKL